MRTLPRSIVLAAFLSFPLLALAGGLDEKTSSDPAGQPVKGQCTCVQGAGANAEEASSEFVRQIWTRP